MLLWSGQVALLEQNVLPGCCDFRVFVFVNSNRTSLLVSDFGSAGVITSVTVATAAAVMRFPTATGGGIVMGSTVVVIASMVVRMIVVMR